MELISTGDVIRIAVGLLLLILGYQIMKRFENQTRKPDLKMEEKWKKYQQQNK